MKRMLLLGNLQFIAEIETAIRPDDNLHVSCAVQAKIATHLVREGAVDFVVIDLTSISQDEIDTLIGSPRPEDVDASAPYEEPPVDVPAGIEFYAFNRFEENALKKLKEKLRS